MPLLLTNFVANPAFSPNLDALSSIMPAPLFALQFNSGYVLALTAVVGGLSLATIVTVSALYFQHRKRQLWHETARIALEKGQPLPPMPPTDEELDSRPPAGVSFAEWQQAKRAEMRGHDFKAGLILIAVGAGFHLFEGPGQMLGAIPAFIGVALLVNTLIVRISSREKSGSSDRKPPL